MYTYESSPDCYLCPISLHSGMVSRILIGFSRKDFAQIIIFPLCKCCWYRSLDVSNAHVFPLYVRLLIIVLWGCRRFINIKLYNRYKMLCHKIWKITDVWKCDRKFSFFHVNTIFVLLKYNLTLLQSSYLQKENFYLKIFLTE